MKPKTAAEEIFETEFSVTEAAERVLAGTKHTPEEWRDHYATLARKYRGLLKQAVKITGIGDSTQNKLIRIQEELAAKNAELTEKNRALIRAQEALLRSQERAKTIFSAFTEALPGMVLDDRYRLDRKIGAGGYGAVYEATHLSLANLVAVKILQPRGGKVTSEELGRFKREGISACRIQHPNAVTVLDFGISTSGFAYLVMELLNGKTLSDEIRENGRLTPKRVATLLYPVCSVLAEAHAMGVIHRDIKPDNIFLHQSAGGEIVKVLDFGLAKLVGDSEVGGSRPAEITRGLIIGTPKYMPPERLSFLPYDGRSDVYSLGIVMYEMLAGQPPFSMVNGDMAALMTAHLQNEPPPLRLFNPDVPEHVERLVMRTLQKLPAQRPTAQVLADELRSMRRG
jgi:eukaryotic-like serine/threonine-protein kinase